MRTAGGAPAVDGPEKVDLHGGNTRTLDLQKRQKVQNNAGS